MVEWWYAKRFIMKALFCGIVQMIECNRIDYLTHRKLLDFFICIELEANAGKTVFDLLVIAEVRGKYAHFILRLLFW